MKAKLLKEMCNRLNDYDDVYIIDSNGDSLWAISSVSLGKSQNERFAMLAMSCRCKAFSDVTMLHDYMAISDFSLCVRCGLLNADAPSWLVSTPTTQTPCMSPKPRV